jgi:hypothetical protein
LKTGELLSRTLAGLRIRTVYGLPLAGMAVVEMDPSAARIVARGHERIDGGTAAVHSGCGRIKLGCAASTEANRVLSSAQDIASVSSEEVKNSIELTIDVDLQEPTDVAPPEPPSVDRWGEPPQSVVERVREAKNVSMLCGPGVVRESAVWGLHDLSSAGGLGVLNTWGAKGVFDWRSHHHFATAGLQHDDFELGGLAEADLIIATGIDPLEAPPSLWEHFAHVTVEPSALARLAELWPLPRATPSMPPLRDRLSVVTQSGWKGSRVPMMPSRATFSYSWVFGSGGLVAADPGTAGYWIARTFATKELGSAQIPAEADSAGVAVACCLVARLQRSTRPVLAVVDAPVADEVHLLLDAAASLGINLAVEVWDSDGERLGSDEHRERLEKAALGSVHGTFSLATDPIQLDQMIEAAGPVVAWTR